MTETSGYINMKKKFLTLLLIPLILTSCNSGEMSLASMRAKIDNVSSERIYPFYKVVGSADFNGITHEVDKEFADEPSTTTFVPYARYNDGFYNETLDTSEANVEDIIIYGMASKSYWLRAPLRINKDNFYKEVYTASSVTINGESSSIANETLEHLQLKEGEYFDVSIAEASQNALILDAHKLVGEEEQYVALSFAREGEANPEFYLAGTFKDANGNVIVVKQGSRENTTCAHYLLQHIITSYVGQTGSTNPSKNQMKMATTSSGGFVFYGDKVHTTLYLDNLPYYPDASEHPELGEWDPDYPLPCYKNKINAKVNIRLEYNAQGWLIKEEMNTLDYNYNNLTTSQAAVKAVYGYKFGA